MKSYLYFNNWVYSYYINRNHDSQYGTFAIDLDIFKRENQVDQLDYSQIKFGNWSKLLNSAVTDEEDSIPQYFGLIALQCYAALLMEHDGTISDNVYRKRFVMLTGLRSETDLDSCFKELYQNKPVQEVIWQRAVLHFHERGINIEIPNLKNTPGRYVQFPKSQVVLNREDLKEYIPLFRVIASEIDQISVTDFTAYLKRNGSKYTPHFKRANNKLQDIDFVQQKIKISQIFNFYCSQWEDSYIHQKVVKINKADNYAIARVETDTVELFDSSFCDFDIKELLHSDYLFFKKSDYPKEYELQNSLSYDTEFLICFANGRNPFDKGEVLMFKNKDVLFVKITFSHDDQMKVLARYIFEPFPIVVKGLRIGRKRQYLFGVGPVIKPIDENINYSVLLNGKEMKDLSVKILEVGSYVIRTSRYNDFAFEVLDPKGLEEPMELSGMGRSLSSYKLVTQGDRLSGMIFHINVANTGSQTINDWIIKHTATFNPRNYMDLKKKILKYL